MTTLGAYLRLMRPANIITAVADIMMGFAASGALFSIALWENGFMPEYLQPLGWLVIATIGLYGGGVVFNDVFDAELDKVERPERPIPSKLVSKKNATVLATRLLLMAIVAASLVHQEGLFSVTALLTISIAIAAIVYDKWGKHHPILGPINMGLCRGLNLLLGMSIIPATISQYGWLAIFPMIYIAAITMISRGEVHGGKKTTLYAAAILYLVVLTAIEWLA